LRGEQARTGPADTAGRARDDGASTLKPTRHVQPTFAGAGGAASGKRCSE
jgi:hypothetical protein